MTMEPPIFQHSSTLLGGSAERVPNFTYAATDVTVPVLAPDIAARLPSMTNFGSPSVPQF